MNNNTKNTQINKLGNILKNIVNKYYLLGPGLVLIVVLIIASLFIPRFLSVANLINIAYQTSIYVPLSIGMTFVITGGGIDLSVGSQMALISVISSQCIFEYKFPILLVIILALGLGCILGFINGVIITKFRIPDFIVTLATMTSFRGLALVHSAGKVWHNFPVFYRYLGTAKLFGIVPIAIIVSLVITIIGSFAYHFTFFGRNTIAIGCNPETARKVGISVSTYKILQYTVLGFLAGFSALLLISRLNAAVATMAEGYAIHVISSVIMGGTALFGGNGKIWGTFVGAVILAVIANSMVLLGVYFFWQLVATGVIVIIAVLVNLFFENIRRKMEY